MRATGDRRVGGFPKVTGRIALAIFTLALIGGGSEQPKRPAQTFHGFDLVDKTGNISRPRDFRDRYEVLGSYLVLDPNGDQMHVTYASPGAAQYYRRNGKFADGTVLVKEILGTDHAQMTTGDAHWASGEKVWFVMIKDDKQRFRNNPLWGDGWGWALFKAEASDKQVAVDYKKDCMGCHIPARSTDWLYIQGYQF